MSFSFDPVEAAVRQLLLRLGAHFIDMPHENLTDAERLAISRLSRAGLVEVEYRLELREAAANRGAEVILRVSEGVASVNQLFAEALAICGWYAKGEKTRSEIIISHGIRRLRLTSNGEMAANHHRQGSNAPMDWILRDHENSAEIAPMSAVHWKLDEVEKPAKQGQVETRIDLSVELSPQIDVVTNVHVAPSVFSPSPIAVKPDEKEHEQAILSTTIAEIENILPRLGKGDASILILGETGVGKEYFAKRVHETSPRAKKRLQVVNCAMLPKERIDSALYGHERGAFTGADKSVIGLIRDAAGGTIFLDELGTLPSESWGNLLRFLQDHEIHPVGGRVEKVDVRIMAATNRPGALPDDVRFRFDEILRLPSLREERARIPELAKNFFNDAVLECDKSSLRLSKAQLQSLAEDEYRWPGNIRQLKKAVRSAVQHHVGDRDLTADEILAAARQLAELE